jgi:pyruvate dehydrogenase E1 component beta subunit
VQSKSAAASVATAQAPPEPDVPDGTEMVAMTVREALRDAMAEEMRRDKDVFVMGEEVAEYQGAYKVTQGLLQEFGAMRVIDTPITSMLCRPRHRRRARRAETHRRVHDLQFRHAGDGPTRQLGGQDPLHVGGQIGASIVFRGPNGPAARVAAQHSQDFTAWYCTSPASG